MTTHRPRSPHIIQAPKGVTYPSAVVCLATRSGMYARDDKPHCYDERLIGWSASCWLAKDGVPYHLWQAEGGTADDMWKLLRATARQRAPVWVASYRGSRDFAMLGMWQRVETGDARLGVGAIIANPPTIISIKIPQTVIWLDARNWSPWRAAPRTPTEEIARSIAELVYGMTDTLLTNGWGSLRMTVGAQSLWTWRHAFLRHSVVAHTDPQALRLERESYFGGRCEPMRLGRLAPPTYEMDIRSAYASAAYDRDVPCLLESSYGHIPVSALEHMLTKKECIADVEIVTTEPAYPVRHAGRVLWPVGRFTSSLSAPELRDAISMHRIRAVRSASSYRRFPALSGYLGALYVERLRWERAGRPALAGWAKAMLVCLPGALGRSDRKWRPCPWHAPRRPWEQRIIQRGSGALQTVRTLAGRSEYEYNGGWAWNSVPAIAGWVTSAARMRLLSEIRTAGWGHVYYIDTDCLLADEEGARRLAPVPRGEADTMGALELVGVHQDAWIGGAKHLILSGSVKMGGVHRLPEDRGPGPLDYYASIPPSGYLQRGECPQAQAILLPATRSSGYAGRRLTADGTMVPLEIDEDGEKEP